MEDTRFFDEIIDNLRYRKPFAAGQNSAAYEVSKNATHNTPRLDYVLLKSHKELDSSIKSYILSDLQKQQATISKLRERHNINTPRLVYYTQKAGTLYQIQERANGRPLGFMSSKNYISYIKSTDHDKLIDIIERSEDGEFNTKLKTYVDKNGNTLGKSTPLRDAIIKFNNDNLKAILACDDSILTKYLEDYKTLFVTYGFRIDNHCENFYFDEKKGITFIDLNVSADNKNGQYLRNLESQENSTQTQNSREDALIPVTSDADMEINCIKEAINETFFLFPFADEETRILNNLLIKKTCRCVTNSSQFNDAVNSGKLEEYKNKTLNRRIEYASEEELLDFVNVAKSNNNPGEIVRFQTKYSYYEKCMDFETMDTGFVINYLEQNPEFKPNNPKDKKTSPFSKVSDAFNSIVNHIKNTQFKQQELLIDNNKTAPIEEDFEDYRTRILEDSDFEFNSNDDYSL